jgi:hypothetical protein
VALRPALSDGLPWSGHQECRETPYDSRLGPKILKRVSKTATAPRRLGELLQSGSLAELAGEAAHRRRLTAEIRAALPPEEAEHLVAVSARQQGEIVLTMDSAAWAARVRYRVQQLGRMKVRVKVQPRS